MAAARRGKDWPQWRGPARDASRGNRDHHELETKKPKLVWMAEGAGEGYASVGRLATGSTLRQLDGGQGVVVLGSKDGKLLCARSSPGASRSYTAARAHAAPPRSTAGAST